MSEKKSIYHEAVADAKMLKETALANAKLAIEQTFTPSLQKLINEKLSESEESSEEGKTQEKYGSELGPHAKPLDEKGKKSSEEKSSEEKSAESDLDETLDLDELLRELEAEDKGEYVDYSKEEHPDSPEYEAKFASSEDKNTKPMDEKKKSSEEKSSEEKSSESALEEKKKSSEEKSSESDLDEKKKSKSSEADKAPSKEDADQYEMYLELKKKFEPAPSSDADKVEIDELDGINIEELIAELEKDSEEEMKGSSEECEEAKYASETDKSTKPMDEVEELKKEIATIKGELNEAVLINAKAISFSRLTKDNDNLTREDKVKILKQIDKAKTVAETKLIFETIKESFEIGKTQKKTKDPITESLGFVNKPIGANKSEESNVVDDPIKARWQMLAGITRKRNF
jgi:hypothetical protein